MSRTSKTINMHISHMGVNPKSLSSPTFGAPGIGFVVNDLEDFRDAVWRSSLPHGVWKWVSIFMVLFVSGYSYFPR